MVGGDVERGMVEDVSAGVQAEGGRWGSAVFDDMTEVGRWEALFWVVVGFTWGWMISASGTARVRCGKRQRVREKETFCLRSMGDYDRRGQDADMQSVFA